MRAQQGSHARPLPARQPQGGPRPARLGGRLGAAAPLLLLGCTAAHAPDVSVDAPPDLRHPPLPPACRPPADADHP